MSSSALGRAARPDGQTVSLAGRLTKLAVDQGFAAVPLTPPAFVDIDLAAVEHVEPTAGLYLNACLVSLGKAGYGFQTVEPMSVSAAEALIDLGFEWSLRFAFGGRPALQEAASALRPTEGIEQRAMRTQARIHAVRRPGIEHALDAIRRWTESEVESVAEDHLGDRAHLIAPGILFEAYANAVMHPQASIVLTNVVFDFEADADQYPGGALHLTFWDDGDSITDTLGRGIKGSRKPSSRLDIYYADYLVNSTQDGEMTTTTMYSGDAVTRDTPLGHLLVAATFPGVTSDPGGARATPSGRTVRDADRPGMGLYVLTSLALDTFRGEVHIQTERAELRMRRTQAAHERNCRYQADVAAVDRKPYFRGNLVSVRLPLAAPFH